VTIPQIRETVSGMGRGSFARLRTPRALRHGVFHAPYDFRKAGTDRTGVTVRQITGRHDEAMMMDPHHPLPHGSRVPYFG